ncbi:MAG: hypothetical protein EOO88_57385 [Pedobacter sp.]|nr:MAG: hypothetical protein EOO88_57385 [Pedobacter sp.]
MMITKDQAVKIFKDSLRFDLDDYVGPEDPPEKVEEMERIIIEVCEDFYQMRWEQPVEVPCGWIFGRKNTAVEKSWTSLVNLWTGEVIAIEKIRADIDVPLSPDAKFRLYIEDLPPAQRLEALKRMNLLPFEPVRFYPPYMPFDTPIRANAKPRRFIVEFDKAFFASKQLPLPQIVLSNWLVSGWDVVEHSESMQMLRDWKDREKIYQEYEVVLKAESKRCHVRINLNIAHVPPDEKDIVEDLERNYILPFEFPKERYF